MKNCNQTTMSSYSIAASTLLKRVVSFIHRRSAKSAVPVRRNSLIAVVLGSALGVAWLAPAQFDPSAQYSAVLNPNGVWTYGFETVPLGSAFNLLTASVPIPSAPGPFIDSWQSPPLGNFMGVFHNGTAATQTVTTSGTEISQFAPGTLAMNAGPNDEYPIVQFGVPAAGIYTIQGTFQGIDTAGTVSSVFLLKNNVPIASGSVVGFGPASDVTLASGPFSLNVGDTLAYAVGGLTGNSMTALIAAQVSAAGVPEPSPFALLSLALLPLAIRNGFVLKRKMARI
jgi:hypothetical protein